MKQLTNLWKKEMTKITCPICGAKCERLIKKPKQSGHRYLEIRYKPFPQPDLTRLKKVFETHKKISGSLPYDLYRAIAMILQNEAEESKT